MLIIDIFFSFWYCVISNLECSWDLKWARYRLLLQIQLNFPEESSQNKSSSSYWWSVIVSLAIDVPSLPSPGLWDKKSIKMECNFGQIELLLFRLRYLFLQRNNCLRFKGCQGLFQTGCTSPRSSLVRQISWSKNSQPDKNLVWDNPHIKSLLKEIFSGF